MGGRSRQERDEIAALLSRLSSFKRLGILSCSANSPRHILRPTSPRGSAKTLQLRLRHGWPCLPAGKCVSLGCPKCLDEGSKPPRSRVSLFHGYQSSSFSIKSTHQYRSFLAKHSAYRISVKLVSEIRADGLM